MPLEESALTAISRTRLTDLEAKAARLDAVRLYAIVNDEGGEGVRCLLCNTWSPRLPAKHYQSENRAETCPLKEGE